MQDIDRLREHFDDRFIGMERWLERVTVAIDKLAENRERVMVVEAAVLGIREDVSKLESASIDAIKARGDIRIDVVKLMTIGSMVMAVVSIAIPIAITLFLT